MVIIVSPKRLRDHVSATQSYPSDLNSAITAQRNSVHDFIRVPTPYDTGRWLHIDKLR
jgi:hypothetical protein